MATGGLFRGDFIYFDPGYKKFRTFIDEYQRLQKKEVQTNTALIKAQDEFINELRKEFKPYETIDFVSYQFSLKP